ncbi:MAG: hypothetical protein N3B18_03540 [Desulfobacterota bacterium]|nr:hypothetical protein [Thermodesulfobacteriota bacterium]
MKKFALLVFGIVVLFSFDHAHAAKGTIYGYQYDYGPFCITESNEDCLGNGRCFASVYIVKNYPIPSQTESFQSLIIVVPNTSILMPGSNYGIQRFGLNYNGDPDDLEISVLKKVGDNTVDTKWKLRVQYDPTTEMPSGRSFGPFGIFVYDDSTTGNNRKNPLLLHIATNVPNVDVYDFYIPNVNEYVFACHIADFSAAGCSNITSALFALKAPQSTLVELTSFRARSYGDRVVLTWTTDAEIDNAGFYIYRAESPDGVYERITDMIIPASPEGSPLSGATYSFEDRNVKLWKKYYYVLEDIDINGNVTRHINSIATAMPRFIDFLNQ